MPVIEVIRRYFTGANRNFQPIGTCNASNSFPRRAYWVDYIPALPQSMCLAVLPSAARTTVLEVEPPVSSEGACATSPWTIAAFQAGSKQKRKPM